MPQIFSYKFGGNDSNPKPRNSLHKRGCLTAHFSLRYLCPDSCFVPFSPGWRPTWKPWHLITKTDSPLYKISDNSVLGDSSLEVTKINISLLFSFWYRVMNNNFPVFAFSSVSDLILECVWDLLPGGVDGQVVRRFLDYDWLVDHGVASTRNGRPF